MPYWTLSFDGAEFDLAPMKGEWIRNKRLAIEEQVETILLHWGHRLLPGARIFHLSRQATLLRKADLQGVDRLGRLHLMEVKSSSYPRAREQEFAQAMSYMVERIPDETAVREALIGSVWYGRRTIAARLGGLIARIRLGNKSGDGVPQGARHAERELGLLRLAAGQASVRPEVLESLADAEMKRRFGLSHDGPITDVDAVWQTFQSTHLGTTWRLRAQSIVWLIAPNVEEARERARPFLERGLDIRILPVEIREAEPGRRWNIFVDHKETASWTRSDQFGEALHRVAEGHASSFPQGDHPVVSDHRANAGSIGWRGLAGPAHVNFLLRPENRVSWSWYSDWWTEGQALALRPRINATRRRLAGLGIDKEIPWDNEDEFGGETFVRAATALVDTAWRYLVEIGAPRLDRWASFRDVGQDDA